MTAIETAKAVLAKASLYDQSFANPDMGIAVAWAEAFGEIDCRDALNTVTDHYSQPAPRRIMPGDVIDGVRRIRAERVRRVPSAELDPPDVDPANAELWVDAKRSRIRMIADGKPLPAPIELPSRPVAELVQSTLLRLPSMGKPCKFCGGSGWIEQADESPALRCRCRGLSVTA